MKRWYILSLFMSIFILCACAGMAAALDPPGADGVYLINGADDLAAFRDGINSGDIPRNANARLTADITLSVLEEQSWRPIGRQVIKESEWWPFEVSEDYSYNGEFDGGGFRISGLSVDASSAVPFLDFSQMPSHAGGLFGVLSNGAFVHGLVIDSPEVDLKTSMSESELSVAGAIAGASSGRIEDCHVILNAEIAALTSAGGIVGWQGGGSIVGCTVNAAGTLDGGEYAGGIAGWLGSETAGVIRNCSVNGLDLIDSGRKDAGGIAGRVGGDTGSAISEVANCTVRDVKRITGQELQYGSPEARAGGVLGRIYTGAVVRNCSAEDIGKIDAFACAGGVVGSASNSELIDCAASGIEYIEAGREGEGEDAGGIVGLTQGGSIVNCTVSGVGSVASDSRHAGGIVGLGDKTSVRNVIAGGIETLSASDDVGGIAGYATLTAAQTMENCLYFSYSDDSTALTAGLYAGGVIGELNDAENTLSFVQNCYYPDNMDFGSHDDKPIGNVTSDVPPQNAASYDAEADGLSAIAAMIEKGVTATIAKGETYALNATALPGIGTNVTASWTSSSPDVVSIVSQDESGLFVTLRGEALGTANVTCTIRGDVSADLTCAVTVVEALSISPDVLQLQEGVSFDQTCEIARPDDTWWQGMTVTTSFDDDLGIEAQLDANSSSLRIYGTPTATGVYAVSVSAVTDRGQTLAKTVRLEVGEYEPGPDPVWSHGSSGCAAAGFGLALLAALPFVYRRKKR